MLLSKIPWYDKISSDKDFFAFVKKYEKKITKSWDELFLLVDTKDKIRRNKQWLPLLAYRSECHKKGSKTYIHRAADFLIINHTGDVLLSKRADDKDTYPGYRETWWGHCWLLSYEETLKKEIKEELWISLRDIISTRKMMKLLGKMPMQWQYNELYEVCLKKWAKIKKDGKEVKKNKWYSIQKIIDGIQHDTLHIIPGQKIRLLNYLLQKKLTDSSVMIKKMLKNQEEICKKEGVLIVKIQLF